MSFPRSCEYILSIEGAFSSDEKEKSSITFPGPECVCVPSGAAVAPSLCVCRGLRRADKRLHNDTVNQSPLQRNLGHAHAPRL